MSRDHFHFKNDFKIKTYQTGYSFSASPLLAFFSSELSFLPAQLERDLDWHLFATLNYCVNRTSMNRVLHIKIRGSLCSA